MKCVACREGEPTVTEVEVAELHSQIPQWQITEPDGIRRLERVFKFKDFAQALLFTNKVGELAKLEGDHPVLTTRGKGNRILVDS